MLEEIVSAVKEKFGEQSFEIWAARYGVFADAPRTLEDVAEQFGCNREQVRQLEVKVIRFLKTKFKDNNRELDNCLEQLANRRK